MLIIAGVLAPAMIVKAYRDGGFVSLSVLLFPVNPLSLWKSKNYLSGYYGEAYRRA